MTRLNEDDRDTEILDTTNMGSNMEKEFHKVSDTSVPLKQ